MSISQSFISDIRSLLDLCKCYNIDVHTNEFDKLFFELNIPNTNVGCKVGFFQDTMNVGLDYEYCIIRDFKQELDVKYEIIKVLNDLTLIKINDSIENDVMNAFNDVSNDSIENDVMNAFNDMSNDSIENDVMNAFNDVSNDSIENDVMNALNDIKPNAWVYVVWGNIKYLIGSIVSAYSLRKLNTIHKIVLMYDKTLISSKWGDSSELTEIPSELYDIFDEIIGIDMIELNSVSFGTKKQQQLYNKTFNNYSINKWQCLNLIQYNKVCFIDSDIIFINKEYNEFVLDDIFDINTPAGCFSNPFIDKYKKGGIKSYYEELNNNGDIVSYELINKSLKTSIVVSGGIVLLSPENNGFDKLIQYAKSVSVKNYYGNKDCYSGIDEQLISEYYSNRKINWYYIHQVYQMIPWHYKTWYSKLLNYNLSIGLHYYHDKPWEIGQGNEWDDVIYWWNIYILLPKSLKSILNDFIPEKLVNKYDKYKNYKSSLSDSDYYIKK